MLLFLGFWNRFRFFVKFVSRTMIKLNLFPSKPPSQDRKIIRQKSIHNSNLSDFTDDRLDHYFNLYIIKTRHNHSRLSILHQYQNIQQLYMQYPVTLKCPCTRIAIKYNEFISQIEPQYHQICSSAFVSSKWIESLQLGRISIEMNFNYEMIFVL